MEAVINLYKPLGLSPLDTIKLFKENNPKYKNIKMTYAGRLDPMAEGVLIVLAGEGVYEKDKYLKLNKEYEAEIVFGFSTDTHDALGIVKKKKETSFSPKLAEEELNNFIGDFLFSLPAYSSYKVNGKPLFVWAREGKLGEVEKVKKTTKIHGIKLTSANPWKKINAQDLLKKITDKINLVRGDFRQNKIKEQWQKVLSEPGAQYPVVKIRVNCSSGTYIRSLANELGKKLGTGAFLLSLKRTGVGDFKIKDSIK